jgi:radical SAM protein with 4Fe4S-binding SPASM domain
LHKDAIENALLGVTVNPFLKFLIARFDRECPSDGSLLLNSLKEFLGESVALCPTCRHLSDTAARVFYEVGSRAVRAGKDMMQRQFLDPEYGEAWLRGFGLMMKGIQKFGIRIPFTPAAPFEVVWNFTYHCNLKCKHCYENAGDGTRQELTTDQAKQVLDMLGRTAGIGLPALSFSGGEPLARKDFFDVAAYARKRIGYVSLASNGTLITKDKAKQLKDVGIDYVEISIDGATPQVHNDFRGIPGAFEKTMRGVENLLEENIDTCIATVIHRDNLKELDQILNLAKQVGARFMHFNYIPTGRAKALVELDLTPTQRLDVLETLGKKTIELYLQAKEEELRTGTAATKTDRFFSTCPQYASVTQALARKHGERFTVEAHYAAQRGVETVANFLGGCGAGRLYCAIEPNGDIKPCVFFPSNNQTILGNVVTDDFDEVWSTHPTLWKLRTRESLEDFVVDGKSVGCSGCPDKYICGGCRARALSYFDGNTEAPDIGCVHNSLLWKRMVSSEH